MRGPDFSDVQGGSSSTAPDFLQVNADVKVDGGPFDVPGWFSGQVETLGDYLEAKYPPWGVIVRPKGEPTTRILVWYDASQSLHVINVTGQSIANEVAKPVYTPEDSSYLDSLMHRINELAKGLPSPAAALGDLSTIAVAGAVLAVVWMFKGK